MPTGYTAGVQNGTVTEFADFAMQCARAFGALISLRDDPADAPIPEAFEASQHYATMADEEAVKIADLMAMTSDQISAARDAAEAERASSQAETEKLRLEQKARYEAMLSRVEAWPVPSPDHEGLKEFMVEQLKRSIYFDCEPSKYYADPLPEAAVWHAEKVQKSIENQAYWRAEQAKEDERTASRNAWVKALRESLATKDAPQ